MDNATKTQRDCEQRVAEEYLSSLSDLNCNSKPLINMLTMLAEENIEYAAVIVKVVEQHIAKVPPEFKLPILYLIDSIVKNVKSTYVQLFTQCIVNIFCGVFEKVNEKVRERMYALRQTWNEVFAAQKLYALDVKVKRLDNNWPITAKQPSIHVNPIFLKTASQAIPTEMEKILQDKTRELLELKKRKLELELEATMKHLEEQEKQICKTTDGVLPPVEALVAANALQNVAMQPRHLPPQVIASVMPPGFVGPPPMGVNALRPPAMFHHNIRNFRPNIMNPGIINDQLGRPNLATPPPPPNNALPTSPNRPRVHPVNSALISSVRQRDPRLMRQQQQQIQSSSKFSNATTNSSNTTHSNQQQQQHQQMSGSSKNGRNERNSHRSSRKSPTRSSALSNSSSNRSSQRSNKSSSREKDRDRKQRSSDSKSYSSSSPSSLGSCLERSKKTTSSGKVSERHHSSSSKCDKDAFEIVPLSSAFKRKSTSPSLSPGKINRDSKRSNKSRSSRSKTASRSPSPYTDKLKDVDLRLTAASSSSPIIASQDKRAKIIGDTDQQQQQQLKQETVMMSRCDEQLPTVDSVKHATNIDKKIENIVNFRKFPLASPLMQTSGKMDIDLRPHLVVPSLIATSATLPMPLTCNNQRSIDLKPVFSAASDKMTSFVRNTEDLSSPTDARNVAISSSPKVSFKILKNFNKLEKSTENLLSAGPMSSSSSSESKIPLYPPPSTLKVEISNPNDVKDEKPDLHDLNNLADNVSKDQEEDGKKRPLAPIKDEEPMAKKSKPAKIDNLFGSEDVDLRQLMPPIQQNSQEDSVPPPPPFNVSNESNANWDNVKGDNTDPLVKKSSLEDVRAKLAKTAKLNKLLKSDREAAEQRSNHLAELHMNEDTQEANDEKIRTMITQAQELLEANSINQEQYKNLVKTVMSINEVNKLKEAQRRESLNALKERLNDDGGSPDSERNAARDAILKKRIPKLNKPQMVGNDQQTTSSSITDTLSGEGSNSGGNMDDDKSESNDEPQLRSSSRRDKRGPKPSKWGDRAVESPPNVMLPMGQMPPRPWNPMMGPQNKRGCGPPVFRPIAPPGIRTPWQMLNNNNNNNNNTIQQFSKVGVPVGPHSRNNPIPSAVAPVQMPPQQMIPKPCNSIDNPQEDIVRTITIDGAAKEIRFYDDVAIVFMEVDQPREIGFQNGQRTIYIDNNEPISLQFNNEYKTVTFDGETFKLRFGYPSRELYIDENWYEIYFGGPAIAVPIRNKIHMLKAEGPPPQVNIGALRRDLVVGKINMIVDAHNVVPLFLDARPQTFKLGGEVHTIQFADNLLTVLLDGATTRVEYGGLPKSLFLGGKKYFIRFGALPQGVVAGKVKIKDMMYVETSPPAEPESTNVVNSSTNLQQNTHTVTSADINAVELQKQTQTSVPILPAASLSNINIDELFQKLVSTGILGGSSGVLPAVNNTTQQSVATEVAKAPEDSKPTATATTTEDENTSPPPDQLETIKPINLTKPESIKTRQAAIIATLYAGMQCSSCGVRFPPEQTIKYSQHLDWHFRQNRRERDTSRKAHARKWYFDFNDWVQYEEVEDVDERDKNFFDSQQNDPEIIDDTSNQRSTNSPVPSCRAGADDVDRGCDMCQEKFEHFYNEEHEEWHLRGAMRIEDKIYHPLCYEDYKLSLTQPNAKPTKDVTIKEDVAESSAIQIDDDNAVDMLIKPEDTPANNKDAKFEDEDDDVIVLPNEEPSVTEIYDDDDDDDLIDDGDDEYVPVNVTREQMGHLNDDEEAADLNETNESDVEIQEPLIPFTDLDTYVEKEYATDGESTKHMFMKVKIKEEPKEDEDDEDDGFEDVGTVLIAPDEISIHSSEETQTQMIDSSVSAMSPLVERPASATPSIHNEDTQTSTMETAAIDLNISMDGNLETGDEHNLSAAGPVSTVPLASLVNKIKINITKNTVTTSSTASSSNSGAALSANTCISNNLGSLSDQSKSSAANPIPTISTIPVLCGGATTISSSTQSSSMGGILYEDPSAVQSHVGDGGSGGDDNSVSTISVIGSIYGDNGSATVSRSLPPAATKVTSKPASPIPPPVEDTMTYELKAELQNVSLKKKEKVICGNETSGLCSIM